MGVVATLNQPYPLRLAASDGNTGLFARARVYDSAGTLVTTVNLAHIAEGLYGGSWTPTLEGFYTTIGQFYTDAGFTTPAQYGKDTDDIEVNASKTNIQRILGLLKANSVLDNEVFNGSGQLTSARLRCYDTAANATTATNTGLLFEYTVTATYSGTSLTNFSILQVT